MRRAPVTSFQLPAPTADSRTVSGSGNYVSKPRPSDALSAPSCSRCYYFARLAREVEERLVILFRQSKVIGGLYRSLGQEGESVATAYALERRDAILPLIRNMGALMTIGVRPLEIFRQYMAKGTSNSRGRDLNIHIVHLPDPHADEPVIVGPDQHAWRLDSGCRRHRHGCAACKARRGLRWPGSATARRAPAPSTKA